MISLFIECASSIRAALLRAHLLDWPSAGDLDGAIADCGDVGEAHPREPLEQGRWSELCGDFRVLHPRIVGLKFVRTIALSMPN